MSIYFSRFRVFSTLLISLVGVFFGMMSTMWEYFIAYVCTRITVIYSQGLNWENSQINLQFIICYILKVFFSDLLSKFVKETWGMIFYLNNYFYNIFESDYQNKGVWNNYEVRKNINHIFIFNYFKDWL